MYLTCQIPQILKCHCNVALQVLYVLFIFLLCYLNMPIFPKIVYMGTCSVLIGLVICIYVCVCVCHLEFDDSNNILVLFFYIIQSIFHQVVCGARIIMLCV